jgi:hypothetical protein
MIAGNSGWDSENSGYGRTQDPGTCHRECGSTDRKYHSASGDAN